MSCPHEWVAEIPTGVQLTQEGMGTWSSWRRLFLPTIFSLISRGMFIKITQVLINSGSSSEAMIESLPSLATASQGPAHIPLNSVQGVQKGMGVARGSGGGNVQAHLGPAAALKINQPCRQFP